MTTDHFGFNTVTTKIECNYCHKIIDEGFMFNDDQAYCDLDCFTEKMISTGVLEEFEGGNE